MLPSESIHTVRVRRGLSIPITGQPAQEISDAPPTTSVALLGDDYVGLKPTMAVKPGERVVTGKVLFSDKKTPGVVFTSPACGTVKSVNRGRKRAFRSIVIELDPNETGKEGTVCSAFSESQLNGLSRQNAVEILLRSGAWTSFRTRPFSRVPSPQSTPSSIFVTAIDSNPLSADPSVIIAERADDFWAGLVVISRLQAERVFVCKAPNVELPGKNLPDMQTVSFDGPHPAGLPGTHIHTLDPASLTNTVWHIGYQDVIAIGYLFRSGRIDVTRVVALGGPAVKNPRLVRTRLGANLAEITNAELLDIDGDESRVRVISGSVLSGREGFVQTAKRPPDSDTNSDHPAGHTVAFLSRYHVQVSAVSDRPKRELFGWIMPGFKKYSLLNIVASKFLGRKSFAMDTSLGGGRRAIVPIGAYEKVMPLDILPTFLFRALSVDDIDKCEALGCLELDEDDLALCTFVCPGKIDFGVMLRRVLTIIEKEG
ncbi:MAG: NADH:ubiquinone reductase (Na(+)-transporting) subunit A [Planctomycetota bacterium]|nr:NADH:ubiquinone reductase (Na(+)-transporting) subunit A [Planctomycetota bacterium]